VRGLNCVVLSILFLFLPMAALAGDLNSPAGPTSADSAMYTLEDIYNRLNTGTAGSKRTGAFTEPSAGPTAGTGHTLDEVMSKAPSGDDTNGAVLSEVLAGKTFWGLTSGTWGIKTGTMPDREMDNASTAQTQSGGVNYFTAPEGYYDGGDRVSATDAQVGGLDVNLSSDNIRSTVTIFGVAGKPQVVDTTETTNPMAATRMKTGDVGFVNGNKITGTGTKELSAANDSVAEGYYAATTLSAVDADLAAANIVLGKTIFGKVGSAVAASGDAVVGDVLAGKTFSNSSSAGLTGTMTNVGQQAITPTATNQTITQGYHDGTGYAQGDADLLTGNIRSAVTIFGVAGKTEVVDTTEASNPVVATRMKTGDVAFVNGGKITGTGTQTLADDNNTVGMGYYEATTLSAVDTDLEAGNIKCGVTIFGVTGSIPQYIAKTGQTTCYDVSGNVIDCAGTGQDAEYRNGGLPVVASEEVYNRTSFTCWETGFTDNGDGTVTDNLTGLIWLRDAECFGLRNWVSALSDCNTLADGSCGLNDGSSAGDWRLPNINELRSLSGTFPPSSYFTDVQWYRYWSSTTAAGAFMPSAWWVRLQNGDVSYYNKTGTYYVWPVCGGQ